MPTSPRPAIILTAAGISRRFAAEGVHCPKWALRLGGKTMLERSVDAISPLLHAGHELYVVISADQQADLDAIRPCLPQFTTHVVTRSTPPGQAIDAFSATTTLDAEVPLVIWNADTLLHPGSLTSPVPSVAWMLVSEQPGDHWSFAQTRGADVIRTAEKERISPYASAGLYGFASVAQFRDAVATERALGSTGAEAGAEMYVAPLYNHVLAASDPVVAVFAPAATIEAVGTPAELRGACERHGWDDPIGDRR